MAPLVEVLADLELDLIGERWNSVLDVIASRTAGLLLTGSLVSTVYFLLPYERQSWRALLPGMALATVMIEAGKQLFAFYVVSSTNYSAVYGSVSSIIVLLLWLYFSARGMLYGAELIGVVRESTKEEK
jgi:membrane protein